VVIAGSDAAAAELERVNQVLADCDYLPRDETNFEPAFFVATADEWQNRFNRWLRDPILGEMYRARPLFDLRPIHGSDAPWHQLARFVASATDADLVRIVANDCLSALPPLTFYEDVVVDESGEHTAIFHLERNALQPLVDVGRVFGLASRQAFGTSTRQRLRLAHALVPEHEAIFREAVATFEVLLWLQGRIGIAQGTSGSELPPSLLSRHDRQLLKTGFRSIHRLLEFTADSQWAMHV
jgi:CBS domain-containing protein